MRLSSQRTTEYIDLDGAQKRAMLRASRFKFICAQLGAESFPSEPLLWRKSSLFTC